MVAYEALLLRNCGQIPQCDGTNERSGQELSSEAYHRICKYGALNPGTRSNAVNDQQAVDAVGETSCQAQICTHMSGDPAMRRAGTGLLFIGVLMSGCAGHPANPLSFPPNAVVVYAQPGQTVKEAVDSLPPAGGVVVLGIRTWTSGYLSGAFISKPHITIRGLGMPGYNSDFTAVAGGTIVLGPLAASSGADYFTVQDLGVDAGQAYINANNGASPTDALSIYNNGQVIGDPPVQSPLIENVSCLG
jgi:hypothetical protein